MVLKLAGFIFFFFFFFFHLLLMCRSVPEAEVKDEAEFSYDVESEKGPQRWSTLHKEWAQCNHGKMQSPIDLTDDRVEVVRHLGPLRHTYRPSPAVVKNRGHDIMVKWRNGSSGGVRLNGSEYSLRQLHWHSPSEHTLNGRRLKLELHMVHQKENGEIAVVAVMYEHGPADPFLAKVETYLHGIADSGREEEVGVLDPRNIIAAVGSRKYYRYVGSLTIPPCTEGVHWTILTEVSTASKAQIQLLRHAVHDNMEGNSRPTQQINHRNVYYFRPCSTPVRS